MATWLAFLGGAVGLHRFYLHGFADRWGWAYPVPSFIGLYGVYQMRTFGIDDRAAAMLIPFLGLSLSAAMLSAIVYGLTPDERWDARFNPAGPPTATAWGPVFGVIFALIVGGTVLVATLAFSIQRYFELHAAVV